MGIHSVPTMGFSMVAVLHRAAVGHDLSLLQLLLRERSAETLLGGHLGTIAFPTMAAKPARKTAQAGEGILSRGRRNAGLRATPVQREAARRQR